MILYSLFKRVFGINKSLMNFKRFIFLFRNRRTFNHSNFSSDKQSNVQGKLFFGGLCAWGVSALSLLLYSDYQQGRLHREYRKRMNNIEKIKTFNGNDFNKFYVDRLYQNYKNYEIFHKYDEKKLNVEEYESARLSPEHKRTYYVKESNKFHKGALITKEVKLMEYYDFNDGDIPAQVTIPDDAIVKRDSYDPEIFTTNKYIIDNYPSISQMMADHSSSNGKGSGSNSSGSSNSLTSY